MCLVIGASRSGYYIWKKQPQGKRQLENEKILMEIKKSHKNSHMTYGSPRIILDLKANGIKCSKNRVARLMKKNEKDNKGDRFIYEGGQGTSSLISYSYTHSTLTLSLSFLNSFSVIIFNCYTAFEREGGRFAYMFYGKTAKAYLFIVLSNSLKFA